MTATRVGFAGGSTVAPTYHDHGDHVEAVEVTYDPSRISYAQLLDAFWSAHPQGLPPDPNPRVAVAVLTGDRAEALEVDRWQRARGVRVDVRRRGAFTPADQMHQKFHLQRARRELVDELATRFPSREAFLASRAAGLLNAALVRMAGPGALAQAAVQLGVDESALRARLDGDHLPVLSLATTP